MALLVEGPAPAHHHHLVDDHAEGEEDGEDHPEAPLSPATVTVYLGPCPVDHLCQVINLCQSLTQKDRQQTMKNKCRCNIEYRWVKTRYFSRQIFFFDFLIFLGLLVIEMRDIGIGSV